VRIRWWEPVVVCSYRLLSTGVVLWGIYLARKINAINQRNYWVFAPLIMLIGLLFLFVLAHFCFKPFVADINTWLHVILMVLSIILAACALVFQLTSKGLTDITPSWVDSLETPANVFAISCIVAMITVTLIIMVQVYKKARLADVPVDVPDLKIGLLPHAPNPGHDQDHNNNDDSDSAVPGPQQGPPPSCHRHCCQCCCGCGDCSMKCCYWCDDVCRSCRWLFSFVPEKSTTVVWPLPDGVPSLRTYFKGCKGLIGVIILIGVAILLGALSVTMHAADWSDPTSLTP
jgi:uncharacterized membrane protein YhaH (DUF805 family)